MNTSPQATGARRTALLPLREFAQRVRSIRAADIWRALRFATIATGSLAALYFVTWCITNSIAKGTAERNLETSLVRAAGDATNLIVVVHHYTGSSNAMADVRAAIQEVRPNSDLLMTEYPAATFSNGDCFQIAEQLCRAVNDAWAGGAYSGVEFVGYSMGALLVRKAYVYGWGRVEDLDPNPDAPASHRAPQAWVTNTTRFVLLAGMNRGWTTRTRPNGMGFGNWLLYNTGKAIGVLTGTARLIRQCEAGEPFVANLRMQWLDIHRINHGHRPLVIQLLGDDDNLVTREDERDVSVSKDFVWVQLSGTRHGNAGDFHGDTKDAKSVLYASERKRKFQKALGEQRDIDALRRASPEVPGAEDTNIVAGVVVLHGIRDLGNKWTSQFEDALQARFIANHGQDQKLCIYRPTYGYFDMISFLRWHERQAKVRWFMDELTELQAKYPNMTNLYFIGHSHGTYVLVSALKKYKALKLDRAVLAGSVAPQYFDWASPALTNRIRGVRNYVGSADLVVAWLPRLFELFHGDLGSAGFNGFRRPAAIPDASWTNFMKETTYVKGAHSAAIEAGDTNMIDSIAAFVINGERIDPAKTIGFQSAFIKAGTHPVGCLIVWTLMLFIVAVLGIYATWFIRQLLPRITKLGVLLRIRPLTATLVVWAIYLVCLWHLLKLV
jgi:predicted esterase